jgi:nucleoside-diphosphate-sugar epimerase
MRVCVVGGTGNISKSIVRKLLDDGHDVTCFTRGVTGTPYPDARTLVGDRRERADFEKLMQRQEFDAVIDMICFDEGDARSSVRAFNSVGHFVQCSTVCTYELALTPTARDESATIGSALSYGMAKARADSTFVEAFHSAAFPVTIIKPSTTYGPRSGLFRQIALDQTWIDRVRRGLPIVVCDSGQALHQFLHVDDAARAFAGILNHDHTIGRTYNLAGAECVTWSEYHTTAMRVLGQETPLVKIPFSVLLDEPIPGFEICRDIFPHHGNYSTELLRRDVPEFAPVISIQAGVEEVVNLMDEEGRLPLSEPGGWEDRLISRWATSFAAKLKRRGRKDSASPTMP